MGIRNWLHNRRMDDPVQGTYQLTGCSANSGSAAYENCRMHGVVTAPGVGPVAVEHLCTAPTRRWPQVGETLPVTVDRADPTRLTVEWDQLPTNRDRAAQQAEFLARSMGGSDPSATGPAGGPAVPTPPGSTTTSTTYTVVPRQFGGVLPSGLGDEVQALVDKIVADAEATGARVTTNVTYDVTGAPGRPMPGAPGGGLTPEQAGAAQHGGAGLVPARARVLAVHEVAVPPGMPGGGAAGTVDITLDVQLPTGQGFATTTRIAFSTPERRAQVAVPGIDLPVLVDPDAHDRIAIDTTRL